MMTKTELIHIDNWYPWGNILIAGDRKYMISDEVNNKLFDIYECNGFPRWNYKVGMPNGPYEIEIDKLLIKGSYKEIVTTITYKGLIPIRNITQRSVRWHIQRDRINSRKWLSYERNKVLKNYKENNVVDDIKEYNG